MPRAKKIIFKVTMVWPPRATERNVKDYIIDAVSTWRGQLRPPGAYADHPDYKGQDDGDPMWDLEPNTVIVTRVAQPRKNSNIK